MADKITGKGGGIFKNNTLAAGMPAGTLLGDIKSYELNITGDTVDTTTFSNTSSTKNAKDFEPGLYSWEITANGVMAKEAPNVSINTKYRLFLYECQIGAEYAYWTGIGICTGNVEGMAVDGEATRNFTFKGTGIVSFLTDQHFFDNF